MKYSLQQTDLLAYLNSLRDRPDDRLNAQFDRFADEYRGNLDALRLAVWSLAARVLSYRRKHRTIFGRPSIPTGRQEQQDMKSEGVAAGLAKLAEWCTPHPVLGPHKEFYWLHWNAISGGMDGWIRNGGLMERSVMRGPYLKHERMYIDQVPEWFEKMKEKLQREDREPTAEENQAAKRLHDAFLNYQCGSSDVTDAEADAPEPLANAPGVSSLLSGQVAEGADGGYNSAESEADDAERSRSVDPDHVVFVKPENVAARGWNPRPFVQHLANIQLRQHDEQQWALLNAIEKAEGIEWYISKDGNRKRRADDIRRRAASGWRWIREWCEEFLAANDIADIYSLKCAMERSATGHVTVMDRRGRFDGVPRPEMVFPSSPHDAPRAAVVYIKPARFVSLLDLAKTLRVPRSFEPLVLVKFFDAQMQRSRIVASGMDREDAEIRRRGRYALSRIIKFAADNPLPEVVEPLPFGASLLDREEEDETFKD